MSKNYEDNKLWVATFRESGRKEMMYLYASPAGTLFWVWLDEKMVTPEWVFRYKTGYKDIESYIANEELELLKGEIPEDPLEVEKRERAERKKKIRRRIRRC